MTNAEYRHVKTVGMKVLSFIYRLVVKKLAVNPLYVVSWGDSIKIETTRKSQEGLLPPGLFENRMINNNSTLDSVQEEVIDAVVGMIYYTKFHPDISLI